MNVCLKVLYDDYNYSLNPYNLLMTTINKSFFSDNLDLFQVAILTLGKRSLKFDLKKQSCSPKIRSNKIKLTKQVRNQNNQWHKQKYKLVD